MNGRSSGLHSTPLLGPPCCLLSFFASKTVTLDRTYRSGLLPYPRSMSSSVGTLGVVVVISGVVSLLDPSSGDNNWV